MGREGRMIARRQNGRHILVLTWSTSEEKTTCSRAHICQRRRELGYSATKDSGAADPKEDLVSR